jgi:lysophospholipase-2
MAAAAERPSAGGFVLWLHGSGGSGDESRQHVAPYFSDPGIVSSVRLSFPTAPTRSIPCYGERRRSTYHPIPSSPMIVYLFSW